MPTGAMARVLAFVLLWTCVPAFPQQHTASAVASLAPQQPSLPVPMKETLTYAIEWRMIRAGTARFTWSPLRLGWQGDVHLESAGLVNKLYRVYDDYRVQLDGNLCAGNIYIKSEEGKRRRETRVNFDHTRSKASYLERDLVENKNALQKEIDVPACVHDIFGGLEKLRTIKLDPGQSVNLPISDGKKSALVKIDAQEHEEVKTPTGTYKCTRYEVNMFNNVLINRSARCFVWLTDDVHKTPVQIRVRMALLIGTINLTLEKDEH